MDARTLRPPAETGCLPLEAVRAYDVRGRVGEHFRAEHARRLGLAYAALARGRGLRRIAVGRVVLLTFQGRYTIILAGLIPRKVQNDPSKETQS